MEDSDSDNVSTLVNLGFSGLPSHVTTGGPEESGGEPKEQGKEQGKTKRRTSSLTEQCPCKEAVTKDFCAYATLFVLRESSVATSPFGNHCIAVKG